MDKLLIAGPNVLNGKVSVSSSKNATLPILAASLLFQDPVEFVDLPDLSDVKFFKQILSSLGSEIVHEVKQEGSLVCRIDNKTILHTTADYELVRKMRASILVLGPLLSRFHHAKVSLPGGCAIGTRPVDIHLSALEKMGAKIEINGGYVLATTNGPLKGAVIDFKFPSVGATENIIMAATLANGITTINNAAREPEIVDLANFLISHGVTIEGAGSGQITITGQQSLLNRSKSPYRVIGDRIEAATFVIAALMCPGSEIEVNDFNPEHLLALWAILKEMGAHLEINSQSVKVKSGKLEDLQGVMVETEPFPGFPTDIQAQLMSLMGVVKGKSVVSEHIFENRFMHVPELIRMGMKIAIEGHVAKIEGVKDLSSAPVMCTDLRASAALVLAALKAQGVTEINRIYHLDRGYAGLAEKLKNLGAKIERVKE